MESEEEKLNIVKSLNSYGYKYYKDLYYYLFEIHSNLNTAIGWKRNDEKRRFFHAKACCYIDMVKAHLINLIDGY